MMVLSNSSMWDAVRIVTDWCGWYVISTSSMWDAIRIASHWLPWMMVLSNSSMWNAIRIVTGWCGCCVKPGVATTPELLRHCTIPAPHLKLIYRHTLYNELFIYANNCILMFPAGFDSSQPFAEETWRRIRIGNNVYADGVKCAKRCSVTTVDPVRSV